MKKRFAVLEVREALDASRADPGADPEPQEESEASEDAPQPEPEPDAGAYSTTDLDDDFRFLSETLNAAPAPAANDAMAELAALLEGPPASADPEPEPEPEPKPDSEAELEDHGEGSQPEQEGAEEARECLAPEDREHGAAGGAAFAER